MLLYEIVHLESGKRYIGLTSRDSPIGRWREHLYPLRKGKHYNKYLQAAWDKYGEEAFKFRVIKKCSNLEELNKAEIEAIKEGENLYNLTSGGNSFQHSDLIKKEIGGVSKIAIVGMSIKTGEIREYACGADTILDGFNPKNIGKCCKLSVSTASGRVQQAISTGKWVWMHKDEFNMKEMQRRREMALRRGNNDQSRAVIGKSLIDGSTVRFRSCLEAARYIEGASNNTIRLACNWGSAKTHKGYVWVFADEAEPTILLEERYSYALPKFNGRGIWNSAKR